MSTYDIFQQTYVISKISGAIGRYKGTQSTLQSYFEKIVPTLLQSSKLEPGWAIVWGPVVWKSDPTDDKTGPDHSWFIAANPRATFGDGTHPAYVVAIAGTADASYYDWLDINLNIGRAVDFPAWVESGIGSAPTVATFVSPEGSYISLGTATGVYHILNIAPPSSAAESGVPLKDFIARLPDQQSKLILTGHSMGGALSPTIALALASSKAIRPSITTYVYPTAGATPGTLGFSASFAAAFPKIKEGPTYQTWNCNIFNTLDIVPQAWCIDTNLSPVQNLDNIPKIYGKPALVKVRFSVWVLEIFVSRSGVGYMPLQGYHFTGSPPTTVPASFTEFLAQVMAQHTLQYDELFGVTSTATMISPLSLIEGVVLMTPTEVATTVPVVTDMIVVDDHHDEIAEKLQLEGYTSPIGA